MGGNDFLFFSNFILQHISAVYNMSGKGQLPSQIWITGSRGTGVGKKDGFVDEPVPVRSVNVDSLKGI